MMSIKFVGCGFAVTDHAGKVHKVSGWYSPRPGARPLRRNVTIGMRMVQGAVMTTSQYMRWYRGVL